FILFNTISFGYTNLYCVKSSLALLPPVPFSEYGITPFSIVNDSILLVFIGSLFSFLSDSTLFNCLTSQSLGIFPNHSTPLSFNSSSLLYLYPITLAPSLSLVLSHFLDFPLLS